MKTELTEAIEGKRLRSRPSRLGALIVSVVAALALAACGHQISAPATEQPDPPSWLVGEEDRTTPAPLPDQVVPLAVGDSRFRPATLLVEGGEAVRIEPSPAATRSRRDRIRRSAERSSSRR
jgi:hypothetical protein